MHYYRVWTTPMGGTVVTLHDGTLDTASGDAITLLAWTVPGSSQYLTRELNDVADHITTGYYTPRSDDDVNALHSTCPELFTVGQYTIH